MVETLKSHHQAIVNARANARLALSQEAEAQRFIDALAPALNETERQAYDEWLSKQKTPEPATN